VNSLEVWQGHPAPLGATVTPEGVNFALFSENGTDAEICLFDHVDAPAETLRVRMLERTNQIWHCFIPGLKAGQLYGYRVRGPYEPGQGRRFNSAKLLLDPYAKAITGKVNWSSEMFGYVQNGKDDADLTRDDRDSAWCMPKCVVVDDHFDWGDDRPLDLPASEAVIYEVHVKGFSKLCPGIPEDIRGTYEALGSDFALEYLRNLGVTAVELLPVHHFVHDQFLEDKGLRNYWGYNSIGFFAPHSDYSHSGTAGQQVAEFKTMVKRLHSAGIEVILDVVYNHTAEGNHIGPTICFRGIDNSAYYRLVENDQRFNMDYTGTGNTVNMMHPEMLRLVMDSLRYWATEMHVDGFRFDLAPTLAREWHHVSRFSGFLDCIHQDPILSKVKLIAEPWDVGEGGYQVGNFPIPWAEWNGKFRDNVRAYWKGDEGQLGELAYRLTGSADLFEDDGRKPYASINFLTAHDGFTLHDTVAYNDKHNEANGERNQDGHNDNRSWNCGEEGPTDKEEVNTLRRRQLRNFLATLILSQGVPMIVAGDEFARTQRGNNNAYCQDNDISWLDWNHADWQKQLSDFTKRLISLRREHCVFRRPKYLLGRKVPASGLKDVMWFDTAGSEMTTDGWNAASSKCLGMLLSGNVQDIRDAHGTPILDDTFLLLLNAYHEPVKFALPGGKEVHWSLTLDTRLESGYPDDGGSYASGDELELLGRSLCLLRVATGTHEDARSISWKGAQKDAAVAPPVPPKPSPHEPIDPSTAGPRFRARTVHRPSLSDAAQGASEEHLPPLK
jgi:glycogen operon protein